VLFVLGGWMLVTETFLAWLNVGGLPEAWLLGIGIFWLLGLIFLLLGMWVSPGNRVAEAGTTLISAAAVGAFTSLTLIVVTNDPKFRELYPADRPMPNFTLSPVAGIANLAIVGGIGWWLFRRGRIRAGPGEPAR
jgi:hypothetical protein